MGSFDTDAFGVLLRMKRKVCQTLNYNFLLSSQPRAGVSKHATRLLLPACKYVLKGQGGADLPSRERDPTGKAFSGRRYP